MSNGSDILNQLLNGSGSSNSEALAGLQSQLAVFFAFSIGLTIFIVIYFVVSIIQKQRQHAAIMRIDKNLERLVEAHVPAVAKEAALADASTNENAVDSPAQDEQNSRNRI